MTTVFPVVILAGGLATRLRPITETIPKSLISINHKPFIHHQLKLLHSQGIQEVILCVGYLGEMIESYVGDGKKFNLKVSYSYDGPHLLGTAGAIKSAISKLSEDFFILYGDSYLDCDYQAIQDAYQKANVTGLMTVFKNQEQWDSSNIEYRDHKLISYDKKNRTNKMQYIDYGLGILNKKCFDLVPEHQTYDLADLYQILLKQNKLMGFEVFNRFYEVGSFAGVKELEYYLSRKEMVLG